jgi:hypothetical protein
MSKDKDERQMKRRQKTTLTPRQAKINATHTTTTQDKTKQEKTTTRQKQHKKRQHNTRLLAIL